MTTKPATGLPGKAGQTLSFGFLKSGAHIYIAVSGGIATDPDSGSRSTCLVGAPSGVEGRLIADGDTTPVGESDMSSSGRTVATQMCRGPGSPAELRVLPRPYWNGLTEAAQDGCFGDAWMVAPEADRMGYRFKGSRTLIR